MSQKHYSIITVISIIIALSLIVAGMISSARYRGMVSRVFPSLVTPQASIPQVPPPAYVAPKRASIQDEQLVLKIPLHDASDQERREHTQVVAKLAQSASVLDISGCKPNPLVYRITINGTFKIINNDAIPHTLRYIGMQIAVPAHATTTVQTSKLFTRAGDYGYGCDNPFAKQGVFMVQ